MLNTKANTSDVKLVKPAKNRALSRCDVRSRFAEAKRAGTEHNNIVVTNGAKAKRVEQSMIAQTMKVAVSERSERYRYLMLNLFQHLLQVEQSLAQAKKVIVSHRREHYKYLMLNLFQHLLQVEQSLAQAKKVIVCHQSERYKYLMPNIFWQPMARCA